MSSYPSSFPDLPAAFRSLRRLCSALAATLLAVLVAGCSSDGGGSSSDGGRVSIGGEGVFSATLLGEQRARDFVLVNDSTKQVRLDTDSVQVEGDSAFRVLGSITGTLDPGEDLTARVIYEPATTGDHQATLTVRPRSGKVTSVALSGRGVDQAVTMSVDGVPVADAARHDFGDVATGAEASVAIAFTNHTSDPASFGAVDLSGSPQFAITDALAGEVAGESTVAMTVTFSPTSDEGVNASLQVPVTGDTTFTVYFAGGYALSDPRLAVYAESMFIAESDSTPSVDDGTHFVDPGEQTFVFANETAFPVTVDDVTTAGSSTAAFASRGWSDGLTGQQTVQPGDTRGFAIAFVPSSSGTFSAQVLVPVEDDGEASSYDFAISGESALQGVLQLTGSGSFGPLLLPDSATRVIELANVGGLGVTVASTDLSVSGDSSFSVTDFAGGELAPGDTMAVSIAYAPQASGEHVAVLEAATANASNATLNLSGSANEHPLALTIDGVDRQPPYTHDFGILTPPASDTVQVVISNLFTTTIDLESATLSGPVSFGITQPLAVSLAPGDSTTLQLSYTPSVVTPEDGVVTLGVSGFDDISIAVAGGFESDDPRIAVYGNDVFITSGDGSPDEADGTEFTAVTTQQFVVANETRFAVSPGQPVMETGSEHFSVDWADPSAPAELGSGGERVLEVSFHPATSDPVTGEVRFTTGSDSPEVYSFVVGGQVSVPIVRIVALLDSGTAVIEDDGINVEPPTNTPSLSMGTDHGRWQVNSGGTPLVEDRQTYRIDNVGQGTLELTGGNIVDLLGPDADDWVITRFPADVTLDTGESATFTIAYRPQLHGGGDDPVAGDGTGRRSEAVLRVPTNSQDPRHSLYQINVAGTRLQTGLQVTGFGHVVNHGSEELSDENGTNFNSQPIGGAGEHPFIVTNISSDTITLAQEPLAFGGEDASQHFTIGNDLLGGTVLAPGDTAGFSALFSPVDVGQFLAHLHLRSDDSATSSYEIVLGGRGRGPRLEVTWLEELEDSSTDSTSSSIPPIARGDMTPSKTDGTILPYAFLIETESDRPHHHNFKLENTGNETLLFGDGTGIDVFLTGDRSVDFILNQEVVLNEELAARKEHRVLDPETLEPISVLEPGEWGILSIYFDPDSLTLDAGEIHPEKDDRMATVVIRTNESTTDFGTEDGIFQFAIMAEGWDPLVEWRGRNLVIPDGDRSPRIADDTLFTDVDFNGGSSVHEFVVTNRSQEVYNTLTRPDFNIDDLEVTDEIRSGEVHATFPDPIDGDDLTNVIAIPGTPNGENSTDASVLARLRIGDRVSITGSRTGNNVRATVDYLWPNVDAAARSEPYTLEWNPATLSTDVIGAFSGKLTDTFMHDADEILQTDHLGRLDSVSYNVPLKGIVALNPDQGNLTTNRLTGWQVLSVVSGSGTATLQFSDAVNLRDVMPGSEDPVSLQAGDWIAFTKAALTSGSLAPNAPHSYEVAQTPNYDDRTVVVNLTAPSPDSIAATSVSATVLGADSATRTVRLESGGAVRDALAHMIQGTSITIDGTLFTVESADAEALSLVVFESLSASDTGPAVLEPAQSADLILHEKLTFAKIDFELVGSLPTTLDPGEQASFGVRFTPRWSTGFEASKVLPASIAHEVTVNISDNDQDHSANMDFNVRGIASDPDILTRDLDTGNMVISKAATSIVDEEVLLGTFRVENVQSDPDISAGNLRLNNANPVELSGAHAEEYRIEVLDNQTLIPADGSGFEFAVYFTPLGTGERHAQLLIPSNDAERRVAVIGLNGEGLAGVNN